MIVLLIVLAMVAASRQDYTGICTLDEHCDAPNPDAALPPRDNQCGRAHENLVCCPKSKSQDRDMKNPRTCTLKANMFAYRLEPLSFDSEEGSAAAAFGSNQPEESGEYPSLAHSLVFFRIPVSNRNVDYRIRSRYSNGDNDK